MGRRYRMALFCLLICNCVGAQTPSGGRLLSFAPVDSFHKGRFWLATGTTAALYTGTVIALNSVWYKQYPRSDFHLFNDLREWRGMDKAGHLYTTYFESLWGYGMARWTGIPEHKAIWVGAGLGLTFQTTIEILDGFSSQWGFSVADMAFNVLGCSAFVIQQSVWSEQRIQFKVSSTPIRYSTTPIPSTDHQQSTTLRRRTDDLFGTGYAERFLKDYNAQTAWVSINIHAFLRSESRFPKWLNVAFGYSGEHLYGGFDNQWAEGDAQYLLSEAEYPRHSQFYVSPDIDFTKIPSESPFVRTLLGMLNIFKMPGPVLEISQPEGVRLRFRW